MTYRKSVLDCEGAAEVIVGSLTLSPIFSRDEALKTWQTSPELSRPDK